MTNQPAGQKSPLDILDEILKDKSPAAGGGAAAAAPPAPDPQAEAAAKQAEIQALETQHQAEDQVALAQKQAELQSVTQMPEYQAGVQQDADKKQQAEAQQAAQTGYEIKQLEHTKIEDVTLPT